MRDQVEQLHALKSLVTEERLTETGRHFVDGNYASLTECHHGDTGEFRNKADGKAIALLWNLWKDGKLGVRRDDDTPTPFDRLWVAPQSFVDAAYELSTWTACINWRGKGNEIEWLDELREKIEKVQRMAKEIRSAAIPPAPVSGGDE
jgi:hypothetical protein